MLIAMIKVNAFVTYFLNIINLLSNVVGKVIHRHKDIQEKSSCHATFSGAMHLNMYVLNACYMKQRMETWLNCLISGIFSILGFAGVTSCDKIPGIPTGRCEYGCPNADYKIMGSVKDGNGKPIKGIQVVAQQTYSATTVQRDTLYSDEKGQFSLSQNDFPSDRSLDVIFNDVDGAGNGGEFESKTASKVKYEQTKKGKSWYKGEFTATANVELNKKASE